MHIHSLIITDDREEQYNRMNRMIRHFTTSSQYSCKIRRAPKPNLRAISLLLNLMDDNWGLGMRQALAELCDQFRFEAKITKILDDM